MLLPWQAILDKIGSLVQSELSRKGRQEFALSRVLVDGNCSVGNLLGVAGAGLAGGFCAQKERIREQNISNITKKRIQTYIMKRNGK